MLSPLRRGSGLYFSTLCGPKRRGDPARLFGAVLGRMDGNLGLCLLKDATKISVQPNINVGSCFQAELPALRDPSEAQHDEEPASLLWKPWGDMDTDPQAQDPVATLLSLASSSGVPGGVPNLELALHCLHAARGDVTKALEMLLSGGPPKSETDPLANYHYAGSDTWTPLEKQLFHRAFAIHKKDFYLIHKRVQTKTVAQCVEYYYIWKKKTKLQSYRAKGKDNKLQRNKEKAEEKANRSLRKRRLSPEEKGKLRQKVPQNEGAKKSFPCTVCGRVFATIRGGNAHMKRHRAPEPKAGIEPPPECLEIRDKPAEMVRVVIPEPEPQGGTELPPKCLENEDKPAEMVIPEPEPQAGTEPPLKSLKTGEKPAEMEIAAPEPQAVKKPPPKRPNIEEKPAETVIAALEPQAGTEPASKCLEIEGKPAEMGIVEPEPKDETELPPKCLEIEGKPAEMEITEPEPEAGTELPLKRLKTEEKPAEMVIVEPEPKDETEPSPKCLEIEGKPAEMEIVEPEPKDETEPSPRCLEILEKPAEMVIPEPEPQAVKKLPPKRPNIEEKPAETVIAAPEPQDETEPPLKRLKTEEEPPETAIAAPALEQRPG